MFRVSMLALALAAPALALLEGYEKSACSVGDVTVTVGSECCEHLTSTGVSELEGTSAVQAYLADSSNEVVCARNAYSGCFDGFLSVVGEDFAAVRGSCAVTDSTCCSSGEKHVDGSVCCSAECTVCGGLGCALLGDSSACCKTDLLEAAVDCSDSFDTVCKCPVETRSTGTPTGTPVDRMRRAVETVDLTRREDVASTAPREAMCAMGLVHDVEPECADCGDAARASIQVCCDAACGECGGEVCSVLSTADMKCCVEDILEASEFCGDEHEVGCIIEAQAPWMKEA